MASFSRFLLLDLMASGVWSQGESSLHIVLEMMAVSRALAAFLPHLLGQSVVLMSDNSTVVIYLWYQGGTVFRILCCMAVEVAIWTERHLVSLMARYIPGKKKVLADQLNRPDQVLPTVCSLLPRVFAGCLVVLISTSLPSTPMPSFLCMYLQLRTRWLGSRTHSSTLGMICQHMPSHHLLCLGRYCREFIPQGSHWFWWCCCGYRRSVSLTFCPCWLTSHSNFHRCRNLLVQSHMQTFHRGLGIL